MYRLLFLLLTFNAPGDDTIPLVGQPANFSGAAGVFKIQVCATPTTVRVEEPLTLTVKITALKAGPWQHPPLRDKLKLLPADLARDFFIESIPEEDRVLPGENAWEFVWRLSPRSQRVRQIPELEFVYFRTTEPRDFAIAEGAEAIALKVERRPATLLTGSPANREKFQRIASAEPLAEISWFLVLMGLLSPPLVCLAAYRGWRQAFPEAAERLRRRRGRALTTALAKIRRLGPAAPPEQVRAIVLEYLRAHLALPAGELTAVEIQSALQAKGVRDAASARLTTLLRDCDEALFAPTTLVTGCHCANAASQLLPRLEEELCSSAAR